jgi:hypothetical protein
MEVISMGSISPLLFTFLLKSSPLGPGRLMLPFWLWSSSGYPQFLIPPATYFCSISWPSVPLSHLFQFLILPPLFPPPLLTLLGALDSSCICIKIIISFFYATSSILILLLGHSKWNIWFYLFVCFSFFSFSFF